MQINVTANGEIYYLEFNEEMTLEDVQAYLLSEYHLKPEQHSFYYDGNVMAEPKKTLKEYNVKDGDLIMLLAEDGTARLSGSGVQSGKQRKVSMSDAEHLSTHLLSNPQLLQQLKNPALDNAKNDPVRFASMLFEQLQRQPQAGSSSEAYQAAAYNDDPLDVEAQKRIEAAIRQQNIKDNMEAAYDHRPESFARVTRLYVNVEINRHKLVALVDTGAQSTVISPETAEACHLAHLIDTRFKGVAKGVGTANILGRIHSVQLKLDKDIFQQCSMIVVEGKGSELLLGLDMLQYNKASIDLDKNILKFEDGEVPFLAEHELPEKQRMIEVHGGVEDEMPLKAAEAAAARAEAALKTSTVSSNENSAQQSPQLTEVSKYHKEHVARLIEYGLSPEEANQYLEASNGDVDMAIGLLPK